MSGGWAPDTTQPTTATPPEVDPGPPAPLNPVDDPQAFDHFKLAGTDSPGLCTEIAGASNPRKWDERAGTGQSGATIVYSGDGLCKFTAKLLLWTAQHFADWIEFKKLLVSPTTKKPQALDFYHAYVDLLPSPVKSVVVTDVKAPTQSGEGFWTVEIAFLQFRAPKAAGAKPGSSKTGGDAPKDGVDNMIDDLTKTLGDLAK